MIGSKLVPPDQRDPNDPGSAICPTTHKNHIHPLGGGMFVCFECLIAVVTGKRAKPHR